MHRLKSASHIILVLLLLFAAGGSALGVAAQDAASDSPDVVIAGEATPELEPTPEPTLPAETSTPDVPTEDVSPTPLPEETPAEPTALPTVESAEPTATPSAIETSEPDELEGQIAPASIVTDPSGGPTCTAPAAGMRAAPGGLVRYTCSWVLPALTSGSFQASTSASGWQVTVRRAGILNLLLPVKSGPSPSASVAGALLSTSYTVDVHVPLTATPGSSVITTITTTCSGLGICGNAASSVTVSTTVDGSGYVNGVSAGEYAEITCQPTVAGPWSVPFGGSFSATCRMTSFLDLGLLGLAELGLLEINISYPADWNLIVNIPGRGPFSASTGALVIPLEPILDVTLVGGATFTLSFTAPCNPNLGSNPVSVSTRLGVRAVGLGLVNEPGPAVSFPITTTPASGALTGTFQGADPLPLGTASITGLTGASVPGSLSLTVARQSCATGSASVQVSSSNGSSFMPVSGDGVIPLANLRLGSVVVTNTDSAITPAGPADGTSITSPVQIATFTPVIGSSAYNVTLGITLEVPAGTSAGTYRALVTVTLVPGQTP